MVRIFSNIVIVVFKCVLTKKKAAVATNKHQANAILRNLTCAPHKHTHTHFIDKDKKYEGLKYHSNEKQIKQFDDVCLYICIFVNYKNKMQNRRKKETNEEEEEEGGGEEEAKPNAISTFILNWFRLCLMCVYFNSSFTPYFLQFLHYS